MGIDIIVYRDKGDKQGDTIKNVLLNSVGAARERGRQEINLSAKGTPISITIPFRQNIECGQNIEIIDSAEQIIRRGKITTVNIDITSVDSFISLEVFVPELAKKGM